MVFLLLLCKLENPVELEKTEMWQQNCRRAAASDNLTTTLLSSSDHHPVFIMNEFLQTFAIWAQRDYISGYCLNLALQDQKCFSLVLKHNWKWNQSSISNPHTHLHQLLFCSAGTYLLHHFSEYCCSCFVTLRQKSFNYSSHFANNRRNYDPTWILMQRCAPVLMCAVERKWKRSWVCKYTWVSLCEFVMTVWHFFPVSRDDSEQGVDMCWALWTGQLIRNVVQDDNWSGICP